jgi:PTS system cellobiose-specific IIC component
MSRAGTLLESWLLPLASRTGEQRHLQAIRDGVVASLPLVLVGSVFLLVAQPPVQSWQTALNANPKLLTALLVPFRVTTGLVALYVTFGLGASLARTYRLDSTSSGLLSAGALLFATHPANLVPSTSATPAWMLPMSELGAGGLFVGIILAIFTVEVQRVFRDRGWTIKMPEGAPPSVARSFNALLPALAVFTIVWAVVHLAGLNPFTVLARYLTPVIARVGNSLPGVLLVVLIDSLLWLVGIHAVAILAVAQPIWLQFITDNTAAAAAGLPIPNIATREFYIWFIWLGGSGASLCLPFLFLRARSAALRAVGKVGAPASLFNINEPIIFGTPIVMNGALAIPFVLAPLLAAVVAWLALHSGIVTRPYLIVPWTLPAPFGAFLSTGGDWRAVVLMLFNLALVTVFYLPFVRAYDRKLAEEEAEAGKSGEPASGRS